HQSAGERDADQHQLVAADCRQDSTPFAGRQRRYAWEPSGNERPDGVRGVWRRVVCHGPPALANLVPRARRASGVATRAATRRYVPPRPRLDPAGRRMLSHISHNCARFRLVAAEVCDPAPCVDRASQPSRTFVTQTWQQDLAGGGPDVLSACAISAQRIAPCAHTTCVTPQNKPYDRYPAPP